MTTGVRSGWIPWVFVGGFAVVIAANATLTYFALSSWTGLETREAYIRGNHYNAVLEADARQQALGWKVEAGLARLPDGSEGLNVELRDAAGRPFGGAAVTARLVRPTHEGYDLDLAVPERAVGSYAVPVRLPLPGIWDVRIEARAGADTYRRTVRVVSRGAGR
ncbi:MAG: FixH family protein [Acetobacterales bacterium]